MLATLVAVLQTRKAELACLRTWSSWTVAKIHVLRWLIDRLERRGRKR